MAYHPEQDMLIEAALKEGIRQVGEEGAISYCWEKLFVNPEDPEDPSSDSSLELSKAGELIVGALVERVEAHNPDVICGVPNVGQRFAMAVARSINIKRKEHRKKRLHVARFHKVVDDDDVKMLFNEMADMFMIEGSENLVIVEGEIAEFHLLKDFYELICSQRKPKNRLTHIEAINRRGGEDFERALSVPVNWLIDMQIPDKVTERSPVIRKWGHLAKGNL